MILLHVYHLYLSAGFLAADKDVRGLQLNMTICSVASTGVMHIFRIKISKPKNILVSSPLRRFNMYFDTCMTI